MINTTQLEKPWKDQSYGEKRQTIVASPCSSYWIKEQIKILGSRDVLNVTDDLRTLLSIFEERVKELGLTTD